MVRLKLDINGKEVELSLDEAQKLYNELDALFGRENVPFIWPSPPPPSPNPVSPNLPTYPVYPQYPGPVNPNDIWYTTYVSGLSSH
jgi:hypothetical protein